MKAWGLARPLAALALLAALAACAPTVIPAGPATQAPALESDRIVAADGAILPLRSWVPAAAPHAVVVAAHGFIDHAGGFALPGAAWARDGIATYAFDQRGFGTAPHRGRWAGTATYVNDFATAVALVRARHPGVPAFALGESMGGAVAIVAAGEDRLAGVDGLVLVAPAARGRAAIGPAASGVLEFLAHTVPWLSGPTGAQGIRPSDNVEMMRAFANDPLVLRNPRVDLTWGLVGLMDDALAAAPRVALPTLVLVGAHDTLIPGGPMDTLLATLPPAGPARRRVAVYPEGWHMLLRDLQGPRVQADVASWILARRTDPAAPLPSGADRPATRD